MMSPSPRRLAAVLFPLAVFATLASCSSDKQIADAPADTTTTVAASSTTAVVVESTTTTATPTTSTEVPPTTVAVTVATTPVATAAPTTTAAAPETTVPPPPTTATPPASPCGPPAAPSSGAIGLNSVAGDFTGDGVDDTVSTWAEGSGTVFTWYLRVDVTGGISSSTTVGRPGSQYVEVLDAIDLDFSLGAAPGSNRNEILAVVGQSDENESILGFFGITAGEPCVFAFDYGTPGMPYTILIGGDINVTSGMICDGAAGSQFVVHTEASSTDRLVWRARDTRIDRTGDHTLTNGVVSERDLAAGDPAFRNYYTATCNDTVYVDDDAAAAAG